MDGDLTYNPQTVWFPCERHPMLINLRINPIYHLILAWEPGLGALSGLFLGHKCSWRSLLGFLLQKHSEMICEKSWKEVPWLCFLFTKSRLTAYSEAFYWWWQWDLLNKTSRSVVMETNVWLLSSQSWNHKKNAAFRDNIKAFADHDHGQKRNI